MHELGLALRIVDIATEHAQRNKAGRVTELELIVGAFSGVMFESIRACLEIAKKDTLLDDAKIVIEQISGRGQCQNCSADFEMSGLEDKCPECDGANPSIVGGKEFQLRSIRVA